MKCRIFNFHFVVTIYWHDSFIIAYFSYFFSLVGDLGYTGSDTDSDIEKIKSLNGSNVKHGKSRIVRFTVCE